MTTPPPRIRIPAVVEEEDDDEAGYFLIPPAPYTHGMSIAKTLASEEEYIYNLLSLYNTWKSACFLSRRPLAHLARTLFEYIYYHPNSMMAAASWRKALKKKCTDMIKCIRAGDVTPTDGIALDLEWYCSELLVSLKQHELKNIAAK